MEEWFFGLSVLAASGAMLSFGIISIAGRVLEKRITDKEGRKGAAKAFMIISLAIFLVLCFSFVAVAVGAFFPILQDAVPVDVGFLIENDMLVVFGFWALMLLGFAIAYPAMRRGFLASGGQD